MYLYNTETNTKKTLEFKGVDSIFNTWFVYFSNNAQNSNGQSSNARCYEWIYGYVNCRIDCL